MIEEMDEIRQMWNTKIDFLIDEHQESLKWHKKEIEKLEQKKKENSEIHHKHRGWIVRNYPSSPPGGCNAVGAGKIVETKIFNNIDINKEFKKKYQDKHIVIGVIE